MGLLAVKNETVPHRQSSVFFSDFIDIIGLYQRLKKCKVITFKSATKQRFCLTTQSFQVQSTSSMSRNRFWKSTFTFLRLTEESMKSFE